MQSWKISTVVQPSGNKYAEWHAPAARPRRAGGAPVPGTRGTSLLSLTARPGGNTGTASLAETRNAANLLVLLYDCGERLPAGNVGGARQQKCLGTLLTCGSLLEGIVEAAQQARCSPPRSCTTPKKRTYNKAQREYVAPGRHAASTAAEPDQVIL